MVRLRSDFRDEAHNTMGTSLQSSLGGTLGDEAVIV